MKRAAMYSIPVAQLLLSTFLGCPRHVAAQSSSPSMVEFSFESPPVADSNALPLPTPRGPYRVGTRLYHWVLEEEEDLTPGTFPDRRELIAQLFYPARHGASDKLPSPYMPELLAFRRGLLTHGFPPFAERSEQIAAYARVQTASWVAEPILTGAGPFPVVVVSPGGNMSRHWYTALSQELASQGYVVAVVSHAHSGMDVFPGSGFLASHPYWHPGNDLPQTEVERRDRQLAERLARDVGFVLDGLDQLNGSKQGSTLSGSLDLERVGIIGHSRGGSTVIAACGTDARIDACIIYDNVGEVSGMQTSLQQPRLTIRAPWSDSRRQRLSSILTGDGSVAFEVVIPGATHHSFTDLPLVDSGRYPSEDIDPVQAHTVVSQITAAFLARYLLQGDIAFLEAIEPLADRLEVRAY